MDQHHVKWDSECDSAAVEHPANVLIVSPQLSVRELLTDLRAASSTTPAATSKPVRYVDASRAPEIPVRVRIPHAASPMLEHQPRAVGLTHVCATGCILSPGWPHGVKWAAGASGASGGRAAARNPHSFACWPTSTTCPPPEAAAPPYWLAVFGVDTRTCILCTDDDPQALPRRFVRPASYAGARIVWHSFKQLGSFCFCTTRGLT